MHQYTVKVSDPEYKEQIRTALEELELDVTVDVLVQGDDENADTTVLLETVMDTLREHESYVDKLIYRSEIDGYTDLEEEYTVTNGTFSEV